MCGSWQGGKKKKNREVHATPPRPWTPPLPTCPTRTHTHTRPDRPFTHTHSILYVRNLPFNVTADTLYSIFGKYGPIRQVRLGNAPSTRGTAFVVYEDIFDAADAAAGLSGFNVGNRYLVVLFHSSARAARRGAAAADAAALKELQKQHGVDGEQR